MQKRKRFESRRVSRSSPSRSIALVRTKKASIDLVDPVRSALMARVRRKHTVPELAVRRLLRGLGVSYRLHLKSLPGTPDIVVAKAKSVIFVHGCFWHRHTSCSKATSPKTRVAFWRDKFAKNIARDARKARALRKLGWRVLTVWECQLQDEDKLARRLKRMLSR